jgi:hypothetical protein
MGDKSNSLLYDDLPEPLGPGTFSRDDGFSDRTRFGLSHLLVLIVLASFLCMSLRAIVLVDILGILAWPVLLGFGLERWAGGHGVWGGTVGGLLGFGGAGVLVLSGMQAFTVTPSILWLNPLSLLWLAAGACWGFYLSVWLYMIVETLLQAL